MNDENFKRFEQLVFNFKEEVKAEFRHQLGIQAESFQHKLDIVVEGHDTLRKEIRDTRQELCEKIKFVDFKVVALNRKIDNVHDELDKKIDSFEAGISLKLDAVAADLKAHRADTEVHKKVYKVKEE